MIEPAPPTATVATTLPEWDRLIQLAAASGSYTRCLRHYASLLAAGLRGGASTFPSLAKSCAALRLPRLGAAVHAHALLAGASASSVFVRTSLLDMYAKCGRLPDARRLFDEMPRPTLVSWNCMVAAYGRSSQVEESVSVFNAMRRAGVSPSEGTIVGLLSGCVDSVSAITPGMCVYGYSVKSGLGADLQVLNSVLAMLVRGTHLDAARFLFDGISNKSAVTWTALASGYLHRGDYLEVFDLFSRMRGDGKNVDSVVLVNLISAAVLFGSLSVAKSVHGIVIKLGFESEEGLVASLINLYAKCGDLESAREVFDAVHMANVVVWTSMISGYVEAGCLNEALTMFDSMVCVNIQPNRATVSSALSACAKLGSVNLGKRVEEQAIAIGLHSDLRVATGLIDMYCKFGSIKLARKIFDGVSNRDLAVWSAMINGYACNGEGREALVLFKEMKEKGFQPDAIVFTHVLTACNYSGLVDEGLEFFRSMTMEYGTEPSIEHHMCIVDLLCKASHVRSALKFFQQMPSQVQNKVVAPIISSYSTHCADSSIELIPEELLNLDAQDSDQCVLMSNMLSCLGKWKKATSYRRQLSKPGLIKKPGWSCIELSG